MCQTHNTHKPDRTWREERLMSSFTNYSVPEGPGSVTGAPNLPAGFTDMFTSRYVETGDVRLHAVIGGDGPPLLLVHGWPETWYAWRLVMPALARDFTVIAVDQRGIGLSDKPADGYDTGTLASDLVGLMDALGHERSPWSATTPDSRSATRWPLITRTGSTASRWPRSRDPRHRRLTAGLRAELRQQQAVAHPVQPSRGAARATDHRPRGHLLRLRVRDPGRHGARTTWSPTTSVSSPNPESCAAASASTGPSTRRSRRTRSERLGRCRCLSSRSAEQQATATTSAKQ